MSSEDNERHLPAVRRNTLPGERVAGRDAEPQEGRDIIGYAMQQLRGSENEREILVAAQREGLRLEAKRLEARLDLSNAQREMEDMIENSREMARVQGLDFEQDADFQRASGKTRITVRRRKRFFFF